MSVVSGELLTCYFKMYLCIDIRMVLAYVFYIVCHSEAPNISLRQRHTKWNFYIFILF